MKLWQFKRQQIMSTGSKN